MTQQEIFVTGDEVARVQATRELDSCVDKLADLAECKRMRDWWSVREAKIKAELAEIMGDAEIGTVQGEKVLFYEPQNRFNGGEFKKTMPDTWKLFHRPITEEKFDAEWLRAARPELYQQFQVRVMRSTFEA
jgi:hypothetical protein